MNGFVLVCPNGPQIRLQVTAQRIIDDFQHGPRGEGALLGNQQVLQIRAPLVQQYAFWIRAGFFQLPDKSPQFTEVGHR
ncbi:hypothetical protein D3C87_1161000 [compost metagenome]